MNTPTWIDRFFSLYKEDRKTGAPQGFIDYFKAKHFFSNEIHRIEQEAREDERRKVGKELISKEIQDAIHWAIEEDRRTHPTLKARTGSKMELSKQVCSLELAKRLKELGVKQESLFYWEVEHSGHGTGVISKREISGNPDYPADLYSAFTVAELGEMLPRSISGDNGSLAYLNISSYDDDGMWEVSYSEVSERCTVNPVYGTEADARAKMLVYLIENKIVNLPT